MLAGQGREPIDGLDEAPAGHLLRFAIALFHRSFQCRHSPCWHWARIVLGLRVDEQRVRIDLPPFLDGWDLHRLSGRELWTLSAVHDGARFGILSPTGLLRRPPLEEEKRGHLVDGGYFENFGAVTLREASRAILGGLGDERRFLPLVIRITSDPGLAGHDLVRKGPCVAPAPALRARGRTFAPEVADEALAPLAAILATRWRAGSSRLRERARTLRCRERSSDAREPAFVHLAVCRTDGWRPALGRVLDWGSPDAIERGPEPEGCNREELHELDRTTAAARPVLAASLHP